MSSAMDMGELDPFAAAAGDELVDESFSPFADAVENSAENSAEASRTVAATPALDDGTPLPRRRHFGRRPTEAHTTPDIPGGGAATEASLPKEKRARRAAAVTSKLILVEPDEQPERNTYPCAFHISS